MRSIFRRPSDDLAGAPKGRVPIPRRRLYVEIVRNGKNGQEGHGR